MILSLNNILWQHHFKMECLKIDLKDHEEMEDYEYCKIILFKMDELTKESKLKIKQLLNDDTYIDILNNKIKNYDDETEINP